MHIVCIGGGPAALYFALLHKKDAPSSDVLVVERNRPDDTFGWGVVFSDETLSHFEAADPETYAEIRRRFRTWSDIDTWFRGGFVRSTGHGFSGLSRRALLGILQDRCRALGVRLRFEEEVTDLAPYADADLIVGADGVNSRVRDLHADAFRPSIEWGRCRFAWLGTTKPLDAFTFVFLETEHGLFTVHAYPFDATTSTFIVECREETWRRAGLDHATEADTVAYVQRAFAEHLDGHEVLVNRSVWRRFPTVRCASWRHGNVVLLGDAAHTAHFSVGSGTKLAMDDAIALAATFCGGGARDVPAALAAYEASRRLDVLKVQRAAETSRRWFEEAARWQGQRPATFAFNLMSRSKRITYDNLSVRDPALVARVRDEFAEEAGAPRTSDGSVPPPAFTPLRLRSLVLRNRMVVSPMCQYRAVDGAPGDWHLVHLGSRAIGGAALVFAEMTDVSAEGRITRGCAGLYDDAHVLPWRRITDWIHAETPALVGIQLGHAGRKGSCRLPWEGDDPLPPGEAWETLAPSAIPYDAGWPAPREMTTDDLARVVREHAQAAVRARAAGFDVLEIHMAHGYLLSSFLTPLSNRRADGYGGSPENRLRFPLEVLDAVRAAWPADLPLFVRISAHDWMPDGSGLTDVEAVGIARALREHGCDVVDVSSGGTDPAGEPEYGRMYQAPFADRVRHEAGVRVMSVGGIEGADHANTLLASGRADLCALARPHLLDPYLTLRASVTYGYPDHPWPSPYLPARPRPRPPIAPSP